MAWHAQVIVAPRADYGSGRINTSIEFYDDVDRPGTSVVETFVAPTSTGTVNQQRAALRTRVEDRGAQIRALSLKAADLAAGIPVGTDIAIP